MAMVLQTKKKCCGCGTCALLCPTKAIHMKRDYMGFLYPDIDENRCIHCNKCLMMCPVQKTNRQLKMQKVFVGRHKKRSIVKKSMSGGAFTLLSDEILRQRGIVYGVVFDQQKHQAYYTRADREAERDQMRGSKYVEAGLGNVYKLVKQDLCKDNIVLFAGTPCHVAGLKAYLSEVNCANLFTVDLLCSNVCSAKFLRKYINLLKIFYGKPIKNFTFRDQSRNGWRKQEESFYVDDRKIYSHLYRDLYYSRLFSRPSCDECVYRTLEREGDITIGDAWGSKTKDTNGMSIVLCNTVKGLEFFEKVQKDGYWNEVDINGYLQTGLVPQKFQIERDKIWKHFNRYGLLYVLIVDIGINKKRNQIREYVKTRKSCLDDLQKKWNDGIRSGTH